MDIIDSERSQIDPKLKAFSEKVWKKGRIKADPNHVAPSIDDDGRILGETWPGVLPETSAEKWGVLSQNTHQNIGVDFDPDLTQFLPIDKNGQVYSTLGFNFAPETLKEKQFLNQYVKLQQKGD